MNRPTLEALQAVLDDGWIDADTLCRLAGVPFTWLHERVSQGLLGPVAWAVHESWRFDAAALRRTRRLAALERDFDATPELAALVADLEDEVAALRARLGRWPPLEP